MLDAKESLLDQRVFLCAYDHSDLRSSDPHGSPEAGGSPAYKSLPIPLVKQMHPVGKLFERGRELAELPLTSFETLTTSSDRRSLVKIICAPSQASGLLIEARRRHLLMTREGLDLRNAEELVNGRKFIELFVLQSRSSSRGPQFALRRLNSLCVTALLYAYFGGELQRPDVQESPSKGEGTRDETLFAF